MPMIRSSVFWFALLLSAVLAPLGASAQDATPTVGRPSELVVKREFREPGLWPDGVHDIGVAAYILRSGAWSDVVVPNGATSFRDRLKDQLGATLQPVAVEDLGDEARAYVGEAKIENVDATLGFVLWRDGRTLYLATAISSGGDPLGEVVAIARSITGRQYDEADVISIDPDTGMHVGGGWTECRWFANALRHTGLMVTKEGDV